ncbi:50S ribosomal protein L21 [Mycoplasmoides genitalium]|uniref:Large ribosomal subunit protein bL21 n=2 Tax=Mycoplasmoides genitalium TaxID=2097 RepID=RL21_MYCGE|nr:50S ribosomal protein L21 [Mycoplasmoides genitalium]P47474.1 RecName: Full=Large ribosomal subunit protein bL21; AltName: Full=50S ribosomal protein L21 [Mycoplasmoides genitalium G37]ABY79534.1 ribosomal protein L21 [synthetic Mycoplasma genitalium JCVI-1.0]AAC71453.1 ribosomal protein L21 [Mycoplasmoides genitalium G37]AAD12418.1 Homology to ribosomal protein L21 X59528 [Mycoplasmoides genitalium]AFQ03063.1 50S ribosomal protein L21 [Mycoplasmoides genitalium M2321]AFQ03552.1 50S riboso
MHAIVVCGAKQYLVHENESIFVEKLAGKVGQEIQLDKVLMLDEKIGKPYLEKAKVVCVIEKHGLKSKIKLIKHISQKHHLKRYGHRQPYTKLKVVRFIHD